MASKLHSRAKFYYSTGLCEPCSYDLPTQCIQAFPIHFKPSLVPLQTVFPAFLFLLGFNQTCCLTSSQGEGTLIISPQNSTQQLPAASKFCFVDTSFETLLRWSPLPLVVNLAVNPVKSFGYPRLCHFDLIFPHSRAVYTHFSVWLLSAITGNIKINEVQPSVHQTYILIRKMNI